MRWGCEMMTQNDRLLMEWMDAKEALELAKKKEVLLRNMVANAFFKNEQKEGTNNCELGNGYVLKLKQNYIFSFVDNLPVEEMLAKLSALGFEDGEKYIKFKPSLVLAEYRKLDGDRKIAFDTMLEIKQSLPSIELVTPQKKGDK